MFDYVISYDIAALILIMIFDVFFFTKRKNKTLQTNVFSLLLILSTLSVLSDLSSVFLMMHRYTIPVVFNYLINIFYFLVTGLTSVVFCAYSLNATNSLNRLKNSSGLLLLFEIPYILFALTVITTPFTKYVFYFDDDLNYQQGPLMNFMLILVVVYLLVSAIRMTIYKTTVTFRRRLPYYLFILVMFLAIILQTINNIYLLFGFGISIGVVTLYLIENNSSDNVDFITQLFNREGLRIMLDDAIKNKKTVNLFAFGFMEEEKEATELEVSTTDMLVKRIAEFLLMHFPAEKLFYNGSNSFIICVDDDKKDGADRLITERFRQPWMIGVNNIKVKIGKCLLYYPTDYKRMPALFDAVDQGIRTSLEKHGKTVTSNDIRHDHENKIRLLEQAQEVLKEKYDEAEIKMQKALEADKSKSLFLAQMSHEIRTPMTAILGMTELLIRDTNDRKIKEHAEAIMSSGKTLIGIINDILDFSKIEAGKLQIINEEYYFTSTFYDVLNNVEQRIGEKRLDFVVYFDPKIPAALYGDEVRIKQIIINLLTNACKYTEVGRIELKTFITDKKDDTCCLNIVVSDTGIGIAEENINKLFNGFERLGAQKNKAIEGTGLGLAITKQLVDYMNGTITVESEVAKGSTFTVRIPQKIVDDRDSIVIDNCDKYKMLIYCSSLNELRNYRSTLQDFNIEADYASNDKDLDFKLSQKEYTHIIIPLVEYDRRAKAKDSLIDDPRVVVGLYWREYLADVMGHRTINMPVSSINLSSLITENENMSKFSENIHKFDYVAPDVDMLVVDDNLVNLRIFVGLLENHKIRIYTADSGMHAIEMCKKIKFDLIFLDHMMPKKDGIETLHEMRDDPETLNAATPVVAFTANAVSGMRDMFIEQGFNDFLSKPIELTKLEEILANYLPAEKIISIKDNSAAYNEIVNKKEDSLPEVTTVSDDEKAFTVDGIDMEKALYYAGNSYDTLKDILVVFLDDGSKKLDLLVRYIEEEDFDNYRIEIHAVKSLCKGIGAMDLSDKALRLETACKENNFDYVRDNAQEAYADYVILLGNIDAALSELGKNDPAKADSENTAAGSVMDVKEQLLCIKLLLGEFEENTAIKLMDELRTRDLDDQLKEKLEDIDRLLHLYDYDGAAEKIGEVLDED